MIRDPTESKGDGNLNEETDGSHGVSGKSLEAEAADDGRRVGIEGTLGTIVAQSDEDVDPKAPVAELFAHKVNTYTSGSTT